MNNPYVLSIATAIGYAVFIGCVLLIIDWAKTDNIHKAWRKEKPQARRNKK